MKISSKQLINLSSEEKAYALKLGVSERFMQLLLSRGLNVNELYDFLHPSISNLSSPFEIKGMGDAKNRLLKAIKNKERILIFGDYDCDGICATSILMLYLRDKTDVRFYIPTRQYGYGLSVESLEQLYNQKKFDLLITVDTGITAVEEVNFVKSLGVDVIVTDHHEPQDSIPDCIVVDPKIEKLGFYDLCGAGVALKLVEACTSQKETEKYYDICAIATIQDVVPLVKDNRIIVSYGLKQILKNPRLGIKLLLNQDTITSQDVMFKLGPRMNAAGRLSTAAKVVDLFLEDDYFMVKTLAEELYRENQKRQELCEIVTNEALELLKGVDFNKTGIIIIYKEDWEAGVIGIAAARLVELFKRPAILFSKSGDTLKGSCRSIKEINLFELLSKFSSFYSSFGGHSQAAGVTISEANYETWKELINKEVIDNYDLSTFSSKVECEMELPFDMNFLQFAKELKLLEPTGFGNPQPNFLIKGEGLKFEKNVNGSMIKYKNSNIELIAFKNFVDQLFARTGKVDIEMNLDINEFQNKFTAQGKINSVNFNTINLSREESNCLDLHQFKFSGVINTNIDKIEVDKINSLLEKPFGTLFVCFSQEDYLNLLNKVDKVSSLPIAVSNMKFLNPENYVVVCPSESFVFYQYTNIIICGNSYTSGYYEYIKNQAQNVYSLDDLKIKDISLSDDTLRSIYKAIADYQDKERRVKVSNASMLYKSISSRLKVDESVFYLALKILEEVNLVSISPNGILNVAKTRVNLQQSFTYKNLRKID